VILIIGEGAGLGPALAAAERLRGQPHPPLVLLGCDSNEPFPFRPRPSAILVPGLPPHCIACMPLLEDWGIASRLACAAGLPGCFEGTVAELAEIWLASLGPDELCGIEVLASGPPATLTALADVAARCRVPLNQLSLANS
jgi:dihydroorotate dehydrogenase electron transfer subunit